VGEDGDDEVAGGAAAFPASPALNCDAAAFGVEGYVVLRGYLAACEVDVLSEECDRARRAYKNEANNLDAFGRAGVGRDSPARSEAWAYRTLRRAVLRCEAETQQGWLAELVVLKKLAAAAQSALGGAAADGETPRLLSEIYVVKEPGAPGTEFDWHRDDAKQLAFVGGAEADDRYAFVSTWAPLDDVCEANGTLQVRSLDGGDRTVLAKRGDVVVFDRAVWHRSFRNASASARRVHYAQFSKNAILWQGLPLWMAVPCLAEASPLKACASPAAVYDCTLQRIAATIFEAHVRHTTGAALQMSQDFLRTVLAARAADADALFSTRDVTVFAAAKDCEGLFYLDGTKHPRALLTRLCTRHESLGSLLGVGPLGDQRGGAPSPETPLDDRLLRYCVVDDLDDAEWQNGLGLPLTPPKALGTAPESLGAAPEALAAPLRRQLFVSRGGAAKTQLHRDAFDNVYCCLAGARTWTLVHPDHSYWLERSPGSVSAADGKGGDSLTHQLRNGIQRRTISLHAGDVIRVPAGWWHAVESQPDEGLGFSAAASWYHAPAGLH